MKISNSGIQCFKACRRMYELKYIYEIEPVETSVAIERGLKYHEVIESILKGEDFDCNDPKISAMAKVFESQMPVVGSMVQFDKDNVEKWFEYKTDCGHTVVGRIDAKAKNGFVVEHKTTSGLIDGAYLQRLDFDEQIPTYMLAQKTNGVYYIVCSTPTIKQRKDETDKDFARRCYDWFDSDRKFSVLTIHRTEDELEKFAKEQDAIINEIEDCKLFYRNPNHCMKWGRLCPYAPICMNYDPDKEYVSFTKREKYNGD